MTSKLPYEKNSQENSQIRFQICVLDKKKFKKQTNATFLKHFLNAMIKSIKIHNVIDIIEN
jgi:imidazoleglycerol phosphate dehydratase HisB